MEIYSIGFTQKTAKQFFGILKEAGIRRLMDVRLNNVSQLAGFSKRDDLAYSLRAILNSSYVHAPLLAPTQEMLDSYKKQKGNWNDYALAFLELIRTRQIERHLDKDSFLLPTVLLCSEPTAENCHRRLVLEYLQEYWGGFTITHL
jgi:uncharacterized protein (DUF488 family)